MCDPYNLYIPTEEEFCEGCKKYTEYVGHDPFYIISARYISDYWGNYECMADAVAVLLLNWNSPFYKYGSLDTVKLEKYIRKNFAIISSFKNKDISTLSENDEQNITKLFNDFLEASMIDSEKKKAKSPVSAAKSLHRLSPKFFPPWDRKIASFYTPDYEKKPGEKYVCFCKQVKYLAENIKHYNVDQNSIVKLIDEYNMAKHTYNRYRIVYES